MINKDFCLNSYIAFRYIWKDDIDFFKNVKHNNFKLPKKENLTIIRTSKDIDNCIQSQINDLYKKYSKIGVLLSGGMDSAIVASYLKPGSHAYTFCNSNTTIYDLDFKRARKYCRLLGLKHHQVSINMKDYEKYTPIVMKYKGAPVHSIEPQIYKAALRAKKDGCQIMLIGDGADYVFGGMDKLLSKDWKFDEFVNRYISLDPKKVLNNPMDITEIFEKYRIDVDKIDFVSFLEGPTTIESYGSYDNAFKSANMPYCDPYALMKMAEKLDLNRIRNGESKYLIRSLFKIKYPYLDVPQKIPMPRPVDDVFKDWSGPTRKEFKNNINMNELTGNQKWQLWCAEKFLNIFDKN